MEMYKGKSPWNMSKLVSNQSKILQIRKDKSMNMPKKGGIF